ncbi:hypothetical protein AN963_16125 [Brevibacillus choshinensis]|uniref:DNA binding HTH domain-containing protein n=1 Tax=Brevibacillus choshinensis TaxID=54911 RepID=A0ABR5N759_BRECH|nr:hypothetical protein AN963_16125 [Brevibacillus choshinensis]
MEYAVALSQGERITLEDLPPALTERKQDVQGRQSERDGVIIPNGITLDEAERRVILHTLERHAGHRKKTADQLGISERGLRQKLKQYLEIE